MISTHYVYIVGLGPIQVVKVQSKPKGMLGTSICREKSAIGLCCLLKTLTDLDKSIVGLYDHLKSCIGRKKSTVGLYGLVRSLYRS